MVQLFSIFSEGQLGPKQTSKMESFATIIIAANFSILDVCCGLAYAYDFLGTFAVGYPMLLGNIGMLP